MPQILGIKFQEFGPVYYFNSGECEVRNGDSVIVKTEQGTGMAQVVTIRELPPEGFKEELKPIARVAGDEDRETVRQNKNLGDEAAEYCRERIRERKMDMKLVGVEVYFDQAKILFYFTSPNRVDFRDLVKDLVKNYRTRIELRQIGVRHETQMVGALGNCGMVCCCRQFLRRFAPVTIKMAKEQNLFLNPAKISGSCGRLLCCLSYEQTSYDDFHKDCPKIGKKYATSEGQMKVLRANLFRNALSVISESGEELEIPLDEWAAMDPKRPDGSSPQPAASQTSQPSGEPRRSDTRRSDSRRSDSRRPRNRNEERPAPPSRDAGESKEAEEPRREDTPPTENAIAPQPSTEDSASAPAQEGQEKQANQEGSGRPPGSAKRKRKSRSRHGRGRGRSGAPKKDQGGGTA